MEVTHLTMHQYEEDTHRVQKLFSLCFSFITGSYDRTCKVWDTASGEELRTLEGHRNVVYTIAFNNPYG